MKKTFTLSNQTIQTNIQKLRNLITERGLEGLYVSSFDPFLNEYVPLEDNHRYYVTGFTGSTAEVLFLSQGKIKLYVDGRYHEQADKEIETLGLVEEIEVVKVSGPVSLTQKLLEDVKHLNLKKLGYEADRTTLGFLKELIRVATEVEALPADELFRVINFSSLGTLSEVELVPRKFRGRDTLEKTQLIFKHAKEGFFLAALDSIAWITNCRGYHLPYLSSFYAKALLTKEKVFIFVSPDTPVSEKARKEIGLEFIFTPFSLIPRELERIQNDLHLTELWYDPGMLNSADFSVLIKIFGTDRLKEKRGGIYEYHSIKEPVELKQMEESFKKADQAIFKTIKWVKDSLRENKTITELDLYKETSKKYQEMGSREQSFNTIAGVGPNASIIHYGDPSDEVVIKNTDMILLDSGGYFEGGWATDTTRTFFGDSTLTPHPKMREMYTLTLKGLLAVQSAVFPAGTKGCVLDGLARSAMRKKGYDYNHGTGHGVGIHVHEPGVRLSTISDLPMKKGQVVSIEPGIYLPGFGGVRLENIAWVDQHPEFENMLCLVPLVYIGFDPALIDEKLLTHEEREILEAYEAQCLKRGTSLRALSSL